MEQQLERFLRDVNKTDGCWVWTSYVTKDGYGKFYFRKRTQIASRVSWILHKGEIPNGLCVCHKCDVPACVNPDHLFLGTRKENQIDMVKKGRCRAVNNIPVFKGEKNINAKLSDNQVIEIRKLYKEGLFQREIGILFGIRRTTVSKIVLRKSWAHI